MSDNDVATLDAKDVAKLLSQLEKWLDEQGGFEKFGDRMKFKGAEGAERVKMKAPNGKIYEVDRSEAKEAEKHGWVTF